MTGHHREDLSQSVLSAVNWEELPETAERNLEERAVLQAERTAIYEELYGTVYGEGAGGQIKVSAHLFVLNKLK